MITVVQSVSIFHSDDKYTLTPEDLLKSSLLLLFLASVVTNSYILDNNSGQLKLSLKKLLHILASDIEWSYLTGNLQPSNTSPSGKTSSQGELDTQLESIEEKYVALLSQLPQKRQKLNFQNSSSKLSNNKTIYQNFKETSSAELSYIKSSSQIINNKRNLQYINETLVSTISRIVEKPTSPINDNDLTKPTCSDTSALQSKVPETNKRCLKPLLLAKK
ncbi:2328_t:CDS:2 [Racocetra persica]|uniref:2328_t:CDS:1 n=1 Tax=Racocetra persica TaxID=160502 RepID=A0ACA9KBT3_9GLOM|nr:2328_t:CDS:2 [Racocetra persica]